MMNSADSKEWAAERGNYMESGLISEIKVQSPSK